MKTTIALGLIMMATTAVPVLAQDDVLTGAVNGAAHGALIGGPHGAAAGAALGAARGAASDVLQTGRSTDEGLGEHRLRPDDDLDAPRPLRKTPDDDDR